jgi:hypothetical protein
MSYLVSKSDNRNEYRVYIKSDGLKFDGKIIYSGHKLGVEPNILKDIIDYRIEKMTNNLYFLKYDQVDGVVDYKNTKIWTTGRIESINDDIIESWDSLNREMKNKFGDYSKIIITKVNI